MATTFVFETHSITTDSERGVATGWQPGELSDAGRALAAELGARRGNDGIAVTLTSALARAVETARVAFSGSSMPILHDWCLREGDYGRGTGMPFEELTATRSSHIAIASTRSNSPSNAPAPIDGDGAPSGQRIRA